MPVLMPKELQGILKKGADDIRKGIDKGLKEFGSR
jgi:hypothetical protein